MAHFARLSIAEVRAREVTDAGIPRIGPDGHITQRYDFFSLDDEEAKRAAERYVDGHDVEPWQEDRKIAELRA
jgi:hypothetical protein